MEEMDKGAITNINDTILKTFIRMFLGLILTAGIAYYTYYTGVFFKLPFAILSIVEVLVVILFSAFYKKMSPILVTILYFVYAAINGLTLACIFAIYTFSSIGTTFLATSALFGVCAAYGYFTKKDMSKIGNICIIALIIGVVFSLINLIIGNSLVNIIIDWVMLIIFVILTAVDMQKIKYMANEVECDSEKVYVYCAMELYLDFINIFLRLISIFGKRK